MYFNPDSGCTPSEVRNSGATRGFNALFEASSIQKEPWSRLQKYPDDIIFTIFEFIKHDNEFLKMAMILSKKYKAKYYDPICSPLTHSNEQLVELVIQKKGLGANFRNYTYKYSPTEGIRSCFPKLINSHLTHLILNNQPIDDTFIKNYFKEFKLVYLNISENDTITHKCLEYINPENLAHLNLSKCNINNSIFRILGDKKRGFSALQELHLAGCSQISGPFGQMSDIRLKFLNVSGTKIKDIEFASISKMPLISLNLRRCPSITNEGLKTLEKVTTLKKLNISATGKITPKDLIFLKDMNIENLDLSYKTISREDLCHLNTHIKILNLSNAKISDTDLEPLNKLKLKELNLTSTEIMQSEPKHLRMLNVEVLYLSDCSLMKKDITYLSEPKTVVKIIAKNCTSENGELKSWKATVN